MLSRTQPPAAAIPLWTQVGGHGGHAGMNIQLLVSTTCAVCDQAETVWKTLSTQRNIPFSVVRIDEPDGQALAQRLNLRTIPAVLVDGALVGVGVQTHDEAAAILDSRCVPTGD